MRHPQNSTRPRLGDALVVVDVQNDFLPGGALGIGAARDQGVEQNLAMADFCSTQAHPAGSSMF